MATENHPAFRPSETQQGRHRTQRLLLAVQRVLTAASVWADAGSEPTLAGLARVGSACLTAAIAITDRERSND